MNYSLDPKEVKKVIHAVLKGLPYDKEQFLYYHLNRNHFNVKNDVKYLSNYTFPGDESKYLDNFGRVWQVQSDLKNFFHMPKTNWFGSLIGFSTPFSRKFLLDDTISGLEGEFEMVIRHDGKRIDALTDETYQETYNFSRTRYATNHNKLDITPHRANSDYTIKENMGTVAVTELAFLRFTQGLN